MNHSRFTFLLVCIAAFLCLYIFGGIKTIEAQENEVYLPKSINSTVGGAFTYQGHLRDGDSPANGVYDFEFILYDAEVDGENFGIYSVGDISVEDGLFSVQIDFGPDAFDGNTRWLAISVRPGEETGAYTQLEPRQAITSSPYALYAADADTVDGLHASELGSHYQNVVMVAKSGGDYTSVQAAIDSINDATAVNPYLVWVAPGVYSETVTMKPFIHIQGAGQMTTFITSVITGSEYPPSNATLVIASYTSLCDLTVNNNGEGQNNVALLATAGMTQTVVTNVTALAQGSGESNYAIVLSGSGTGAILQQVKAIGENGSSINSGLLNSDGSVVVLQGGFYTGRGGTDARGIVSTSNSKLDAESVAVLGENGSSGNMGLSNSGVAILRGGVFTGHGGELTHGIYNTGSGGTLDADSITVLGENGSSGNNGLSIDNSELVTLHGGTFTGRGGTYANGINNWDTTTFIAEDVTALGENGSDSNTGLSNYLTESVTLRGGSFIGRGGTNAYGIRILGLTFKAEFITVLGENGSNSNYGFYHSDSDSTNIYQSILGGATNSIKSEYGYFTVSNSQLVGGSVSTDNGAVTCVLVTRGTTISTDGSTCP